MEDIRKQLQCKSCLKPMFPPFLMCAKGENVCEDCRKKHQTCPLCNKKFTNNSNATLEALAHLPCFECSKCKAPLKLVELKEHYNKCCKGDEAPQICCPIEKCTWKGRVSTIADHWRSKKLSLYPYVQENICRTKLTSKNNSYFCNIVEAVSVEFFFKSMCNEGKYFWALQYVGDPSDAEKYYYEIEVFNPNKLACKFLLSSYSQSIEINNKELFKEGASIFTPKELLNPYLTNDGILFYNLRVSKVDQEEMEKQRKTVNKLLEKYVKK